MPDSSSNRAIMIVLAYLWVLALVPLAVEKADPEIQWHAKHGILLTVAELILLVVYLAIVTLVSVTALGFGLVLGFLLIFVWVGILGLHVAAIVRGVGGGRLLIPGISGYADRF